MSYDGVLKTVEMRCMGLNKLRTMLGDKNIDYKELGGYEVFDNKSEFEKNIETLDFWNKSLKNVSNGSKIYGVDLKKIGQSGFLNFQYCIKNRFEGQINTGLMMASLLKLAYSLDIRVLNGVEVKSFEDVVTGVNICLKGDLDFFTQSMIIATNGFAAQLLPKYDVKPARAQVMITKPIKDLKIKGCFHYQEGFYYFRNIENRVLFGGGRNMDIKGEETSEFGTTLAIQTKLQDVLKNNILPNTSYEIDQIWSGIMGVGSEKKPIIERISENVVCAVRMGGMGVAIGSLVGELAVKKLMGK